MLCLGGPSSGAKIVDPETLKWAWDAPQSKINHIDVSKAPEIKIWVSYLDRKLKPVDHEAFVKRFVVLKKPKKGKASPLFSFLRGELEIPEEGGEDDDDKAEEEDSDLPEPVLTLGSEEESGGAAVVIAPGTSAKAYKEGALGEAQKTAIGLVLKALSNTKYNVMWVQDQVQTYVEGDNRAGLSRYETARKKCLKWQMRVLRGDTPQPEKEGDPPPKDKDQVVCGLLGGEGAAAVPAAIAEASYTGFWPHMFGLRGDVCGTPTFERGSGGDFEMESKDFPETPSAFDIALENVVRDGVSGKPRVMVIIGDGKDGYILGQEECMTRAQTKCEQSVGDRPRRRQMQREGLSKAQRRAKLKEWRANRRTCIEKEMAKRNRFEQQKFAERLPAWLALAKSANVRIHTLANPLARPFEAQRLEALALKTGGTYRRASNSVELVEFATELADELANQYVFTFTDTAATPNTDHGYMVRIEYDTGKSSGKSTTPVRRVHVPAAAEGFGIWVSQLPAMGQQKLGKAGFIAVVAALALVVLLLLFKLLKKVFGKGAKAAGGAAKGAGKAAKSGAKLAKGGAKMKAPDGKQLVRKIKK